jgi:hypothetical protein
MERRESSRFPLLITGREFMSVVITDLPPMSIPIENGSGLVVLVAWFLRMPVWEQQPEIPWNILKEAEKRGLVLGSSFFVLRCGVVAVGVGLVPFDANWRQFWGKLPGGSVGQGKGGMVTIVTILGGEKIPRWTSGIPGGREAGL